MGGRVAELSDPQGGAYDRVCSAGTSGLQEYPAVEGAPVAASLQDRFVAGSGRLCGTG